MFNTSNWHFLVCFAMNSVQVNTFYSNQCSVSVNNFLRNVFLGEYFYKVYYQELFAHIKCFIISLQF